MIVCRSSHMPLNVATGLAITNPLVKYRALLATKAITPDNGQLRLALHLQKLYDRLKDYEPQVEYSKQLAEISRAVGERGSPTSDHHHGPSRGVGNWRIWFEAKERRDSLALTRRLSSHETAMEMSSPKGLMLHGEVGTGKSMLIDLFADCLPNRKKRRRHFNTFMLETYAKLEAFRRERLHSRSAPAATPSEQDDDYSLAWIAKDLVQTSPILFLDEFQMPDRVASKILTNLMTSFFQLGGVLVATSNRMPEELAKASGIEFTPPPSRLESLTWRFGSRRKRSSMYGGQNEFIKFLEVLKARCEVWEMEGGQDYRRMESGTVTPVADESAASWQLDGHDDLVAIEEAVKSESESIESTPLQQSQQPRYYHIAEPSETTMAPAAQIAYESALQLSASVSTTNPLEISFAPTTMTVYGRSIPIPRSHPSGITQWTFQELCHTPLGPADYITLASTYHTLILTNVPILTSLLANEARRFITLLDALYECRCKLFILAAAGPDDLFFPEKADASSSGSTNSDSIQAETFSEAYQDATAPFRPNILTQNPNYAEPDPEPNYAHARLAGLLSHDALEDDPPNKPANDKTRIPNPFARSFGRTDSQLERPPLDPDDDTTRRYRSPDFGRTSAFTGEDERFAYKRAQSRLWEMCGAKWWGRMEEGWHRPLPVEVRRWQRSEPGSGLSPTSAAGAGKGDVQAGRSEVDSTRSAESFKHRAHSPFRTVKEEPPRFSWVHAWGTMRWGAKVGLLLLLFSSQCWI